MIVQVRKDLIQDGIYTWNGFGWDLVVKSDKLDKPSLVIKDGQILWLPIPKPSKNGEPPKEPKEQK